MRLSLGPLVSEKTEQHTATVTLTNLLKSSCDLDGYPTLRFFDGRGRILRFVYSHRGDQMITAAPPRPVHLAAGGSAYVAFNKTACTTFTGRYARTVHVELPRSPTSVSIALTPSTRRIEYCRDTEVSRTVTVSPIVATRADMFCRSEKPCGP
jgi:hypothetical protein